MTKTKTKTTQTGIVVSTGLAAGTCPWYWPECGPMNHAEGIVVTTCIVSGVGAGAGKCNVQDLHFNHAEGIVVSTSLAAGGYTIPIEVPSGPRG